MVTRYVSHTSQLEAQSVRGNYSNFRVGEDWHGLTPSSNQVPGLSIKLYDM